jgi:type II secretory pathway pseudopilin PulG
MRTNRRFPRSGARGSSLLEAMIALAILLVGLLGMMRLQFYGMSATQGARAQTVATQLATELAAGLERLSADDLRLTGSSGATDSTPPATFGYILGAGGSVPTTGANLHTYQDSNPIPGVRLDATLERDPEDSTKPIYQRSWTVWDAGTTTGGAASKVIAVSVIYRERTLSQRREIVVYAHSAVTGSFMANLNAFN